jgi:GntR family transcriptional repressor for pyruvate dehydrogenase complex
MGMTPVNRVPVTNLVVEKIKDYLESGAISVGDKLPTEKAFCEQLGVGRSTVREAIRILQAIGYVDMRPGKGAFLLRDRPPAPGAEIKNWFRVHSFEIADFVEVRMAIEPLAIRLAIQRGTKDEINKIEQMCVNFESSLEQGDEEKLGYYDAQFHLAIVEAAHNPLLKRINDTILESLTDFRETTFRVKRNALNAVEPHRRILKGIKDRDVDMAVEEMLAHLQRVVDDMDYLVEDKEEE